MKKISTVIAAIGSLAIGVVGAVVIGAIVVAVGKNIWVLLGGFFLLSVLALYFLPTVVAQHRNTSNCGGVFILNFFLGWTFLFWVIALAIACGSNHGPQKAKTTATTRKTTAEMAAARLGRMGGNGELAFLGLIIGSVAILANNAYVSHKYALHEQAAHEQVLQAAERQASRERAQTARDLALLEQATREQTARDQAAREQAIRDRAAEQAASEQSARDYEAARPEREAAQAAEKAANEARWEQERIASAKRKAKQTAEREAVFNNCVAKGLAGGAEREHTRRTCGFVADRFAF